MPGADAKLSDELRQWLAGDGERTIGSLVDVFGEKSFAVLFVVLMAVPALPLPTGGATHVLEIVTVLLALQLIAGRRRVWLPRRWRGIELAGPRRQRFVEGLTRLIGRLERISRPRMKLLLGTRAGDLLLGLLVVAGAVAAFVAPPFTGLDTLPSLGVVVLSLGALLEDGLIAAAGVLLEVAGIALTIALGRAAFSLLT